MQWKPIYLGSKMTLSSQININESLSIECYSHAQYQVIKLFNINYFSVFKRPVKDYDAKNLR